MKYKAKSIETLAQFPDFSSQIHCIKHPNPSQVGVCAPCLRGKLVKLASSDAGLSSYRHSTGSVDLDGAGKFTFFAENEETTKTQSKKSDLFMRSNSGCADGPKGPLEKFWRVKRLFGKGIIKLHGSPENFGFSGGQSGINYRVRSMSSSFSVAKMSDVTNGFSQFDGVFPVMESGDFIDLDFDFSSESDKQDFSESKNGCKRHKMYVTRPLSKVLKSPKMGQPDGPNSGCLVIQDQESETYSFFGLWRNRKLKLLPFPQDKELSHRFNDSVLLIPVINQPLDSNRYYAIVPHGPRKGEAYTCSREDDKITCCFCRLVNDIEPMPLDPKNIYQQFQISPYNGGFIATSKPLDSFPPSFLRREGWTIHTKTPHNFKLDTANGLDPVLRARLPDFDFPISREFSKPLVVGKWYSPFIFVKEGTLHEQVKRSVYYEWTLEQRWEKIFACRNKGNDNRVVIDEVFEDEQAFVGGVRGEWDEKSSGDGVVWYVGYGSEGEKKTSVGLRVEIVERMRPLSQVLKSPEFGQPDGPNSGCLVIQDEESETYSCFGLCRNRRLKLLPFPQDKELLVRYTTTNGQTTTVYEDPVFLIPVIDLPLDSNRYYAIVPHGKRKGEAYTCSREDDKTTCCFCRFVKDVKPRPLDPQNIYQQFQISPYEALCSGTGGFIATSIALDGFPPSFLRREGWTIHTKTPHNFKLDTANGLDPVLRARLPDFDFPISREFSEPLVVGKWCSPFVFVKEGTLHEQVKRSVYYEWTLEQRWEKIFACRNEGNDNRVAIDDVFEDERTFVGGVRGEWDEKSSVDGVVWYVGCGSEGEKKTSVGLRVEIVERMRRMDGSLVMCCEFRHFHHVRAKWE
ncbi:hypothetical protein STAS_05725, partial [Striga asiatica]